MISLSLSLLGIPHVCWKPFQTVTASQLSYPSQKRRYKEIETQPYSSSPSVHHHNPSHPMEVQIHREPEKQKSYCSPNLVGEKPVAATGTREEQQEEKKQTTPTRSPSPSPSSSPSHEFSFTISLCSSNTHKQNTSSFAIDLSPADELFLHGQLLPLHHLSHTTNSPRSSTTSLENLPKHDDRVEKNSDNPSNSSYSSNTSRKPKSFSFSAIRSRWRKAGETEEREEGSFSNSFSRILHKYLRAARPLFGGVSGGGRRVREQEKRGVCRQAYSSSFSGNLRWKGWSGRGGGEWSAPASKRSSPSNSGLLVANGSTFSSYSSNDSTMEELQNAIQAAIAHCKNSIEVKDETCKR